MTKDLVKLNKITEKTWRWLKVNETELKDVAIPEYLPFNDNNIINDSAKKYIETDSVNIQNVVNKFGSYDNSVGISEEVNLINEDNCNFKYILHIKGNEKVNEPIIIDYSLNDANSSLIENITIVAEKYSEVTILIKYGTNSDDYMFHNGMIKIYADDNSTINLVKVQTLNDKSINMEAVAVYAGYNTKVNTSIIDVGSHTSIQSYSSYLIGNGSKATLKNIYFGANNNILDMNYTMNHIGKKSDSSIIVKGALKDGSKKTFRGTIDFKQGATESTGEESENVMLLSDNVKTDSVPLLLCGEDDVSGAHAASVGKINEEKLFYLMSRGFSKKEANKIIIEGEFSSIINTIPDESTIEMVVELIQRRLENE